MGSNTRDSLGNTCQTGRESCERSKKYFTRGDGEMESLKGKED